MDIKNEPLGELASNLAHANAYILSNLQKISLRECKNWQIY
ncbi:hypothetical protein GCM10010525_33520 [Glutamicibacter bergerei]